MLYFQAMADSFSCFGVEVASDLKSAITLSPFSFLAIASGCLYTMSLLASGCGIE